MANELSYGTAGETGQKRLYGSGSKHRLNVIAVCLCLFIPWLLFSAVFSVNSFSWKRTNPSGYQGIILLALICVICTGMLAFQSYRKRAFDPEHQPTWYIVLFVTTLAAFVLAMVGGMMNFKMNMSGVYDLQNLNEYGHVDAARMRGQQMMDAGRVDFVNGSKLDMNFAIGFTNGDVYCVAPITSNAAPLSTYDFWAVGKNCCTGSAGNFHCGQFNNPNAHAGLRVVDDSSRQFYRLAVQQAQATFSIHAEHPLFFYWTQDPDADQASQLANCWSFFSIGILGHFMMQLLIVLVCACCFGSSMQARKLLA